MIVYGSMEEMLRYGKPILERVFSHGYPEEICLLVGALAQLTEWKDMPAYLLPLLIKYLDGVCKEGPSCDTTVMSMLLTFVERIKESTCLDSITGLSSLHSVLTDTRLLRFPARSHFPDHVIQGATGLPISLEEEEKEAVGLTEDNLFQETKVRRAWRGVGFSLEILYFSCS